MSLTTFALSLATAAAALTLAACSNFGARAPAPATTPPAASAPQPAAASCNAQPAQSAVGQNSTSSVVESARSRSGAKMARILRPGQIITKEFDAQRLNLEVDASGKIVAARCG
jgi:hypothetical protein